jgi:hypothetical protein
VAGFGECRRLVAGGRGGHEAQLGRDPSKCYAVCPREGCPYPVPDLDRLPTHEWHRGEFPSLLPPQNKWKSLIGKELRPMVPRGRASAFHQRG